MSNYRVIDAKTYVHESVRGGRCVNDPAVLEAINDACQMLLAEGDWKGTIKVLRLCAYNGFAHLPRAVEAILKIDIFGKPKDVWHRAWEFVEPGPGDICYQTPCADLSLMDAGNNHATFWPFLIEGMRVAAFSTSAADAALTMDIYGTKGPYNEDVRRGAGASGAGEVLRISQWTGGVDGEIDWDALTANLSTDTYLDITSIRKPVTEGYITFFGYDPTTNNIQYLAKYHPNELDPSFRWYRIPGASLNTAVQIKMLVKIGFVKLAFDDEVLPIQNLPAIEMAIKAIDEKKRGSFELGLAYQADAIRLLQKELRNLRREQKVLDVRIEGHLPWGSSINEV